MSKIVETIHHGNYRSTREMRWFPPTREELARFVEESPYPPVDVERVTERLWAIVNNGSTYGGAGELDQGWVHWRIS